MLAGYTGSGKPVYKVFCVEEGKFNIVGDTYTIDDYFDAHCVFLFLSQKERHTQGSPELERHYEFLSSAHHYALIRSDVDVSTRPYFDYDFGEKLRRGSMLAKLSRIAFQG